ncbi:GNAT family N-acetyltransferase [Nocardia sp. CA-128927]|uniref:GNAT family N-acetyltransferase n=1 Tax=Nocardia sp. CA-128927 TaxID=3239975 RepID=UPI003D95D54D
MSDPIALYREVFALAPDDPAPTPRLLAALSRNGGIALAAHMAGELVGFSYGFPGLDPAGEGRCGAVYHYMELLVVRADRRNSGIGRALMYHLRESVLRRGLHSIRWAFDPMRFDNAYFYLDVLGVRGGDFVPNLYGIEDSGRDRGHRTDRIIAHWELTRPAVAWASPPAGLAVGVPEIDGQGDVETVLLAVGRSAEHRGYSGRFEPERRICIKLGELIADGFQAVSCRSASDGLMVYRLVADLPGTEPDCHR